MPAKYSMNALEQGTEICDMPDRRIGKYDFLMTKVTEAEGRCVKVNRETFEIGASNLVIDAFIRNVQSYIRRKGGFEINGMSQNGSIYFWKQQEE